MMNLNTAHEPAKTIPVLSDISVAQNRIMDCIAKNLPITEAIFEGLFIKGEAKIRLLESAKDVRHSMKLPASSNLQNLIERTAQSVKETLDLLSREREMSEGLRS